MTPPHISIVAFLASVFLVMAAPALASPVPQSLDAEFVIMRKGEPIGMHAVRVREEADGRIIADTTIDMKVKFGFITLFRYSHSSQEIWRDGKVLAINSRTYDNGREKYLNARREGDMLQVDGTQFQGEIPIKVIPSSYWNKAIVDCRAIIDTQDGDMIEVEVDKVGPVPALTEDGGAVEADKYRLSGSVDLDLWYQDDRWVGARFTVRGETLTYALKQTT